MIQGRRVLIVDDHPVVRRGLRALLANEPWVDEIIEASTVAEALKEAVTSSADVIAMDVGLPDGDGLEATRKIRQVRPEAKILILTMSNDEEIVARALRSGANGYVLKDTDPDAIVDALKAIAEGGVVLGPRIGLTMLTTLRHAPVDLPEPLRQLTLREREILSHLVKGSSNALIARHLGLSEKTVRNQLSMIFTKLKVADRVQAALLARDVGFS